MQTMSFLGVTPEPDGPVMRGAADSRRRRRTRIPKTAAAPTNDKPIVRDRDGPAAPAEKPASETAAAAPAEQPIAEVVRAAGRRFPRFYINAARWTSAQFGQTESTDKGHAEKRR
jgi:hypothetical protein